RTGERAKPRSLRITGSGVGFLPALPSMSVCAFCPESCQIDALRAGLSLVLSRGICLASCLLSWDASSDLRKEKAPSMSTNRNRNLATFLLVLGAVVFGMILAGGLQMTVPSQAADQDPNLSATRLAAQHATATLPSFADLAEAVEPAVVSIQAAT